jgi:putative oxidoreductase
MTITQQSTEVSTQSQESLLERGERILRRVSLPALRISLGLVFVWFGTLKVLGDSPVAELVRATVPWADPRMLVPILGWVEIVLGLALLAGRPRRLALVAVAAHLAGTFLTFVQAPSLVIANGNPLLLTGNGEFVLKNLVLICAALALLGQTSRSRVSTGNPAS